MAAAWYYSKNGQKIGPVDEAEIRRLAQTGRLAPADLVWRTGEANWAQAASIPGLFPGPPPLPSVSVGQVGPQFAAPVLRNPQPGRSGGTKWVIMGVAGVVALGVFLALQGMMNSHNRRRQDAIDFHRREAADALRRAEDSLRGLGR